MRHDDTATLEEVQIDKYELICRKLALEPGCLLDIGCGWGGMLCTQPSTTAHAWASCCRNRRPTPQACRRTRLGDRAEVRRAAGISTPGQAFGPDLVLKVGVERTDAG